MFGTSDSPPIPTKAPPKRSTIQPPQPEAPPPPPLPPPPLPHPSPKPPHEFKIKDGKKKQSKGEERAATLPKRPTQVTSSATPQHAHRNNGDRSHPMSSVDRPLPPPPSNSQPTAGSRNQEFAFSSKSSHNVSSHSRTSQKSDSVAGRHAAAAMDDDISFANLIKNADYLVSDQMGRARKPLPAVPKSTNVSSQNAPPPPPPRPPKSFVGGENVKQQLPLMPSDDPPPPPSPIIPSAAYVPRQRSSSMRTPSAVSSSQRAGAAAGTPSADVHSNPYDLAIASTHSSEPDVYNRLAHFADRPSWLKWVQQLEVAEGMDRSSVQLQESMFELLTSEASYYKSLNLVVSGFFQHAELVAAISDADKRLLMSNIEQIRDLSKTYACVATKKLASRLAPNMW